MIITLIGIGLFVLGIIGLKFSKSEGLEAGSFVAIIIGFFWIFACSTLIVINTVTAEKDIYNARLERECIVKQLEIINSDYEDISKSTVIQNLYDWNEKVHDTKYWSSNPLTNWFWNKKYVDSLEYIELED